MTGAGHRKKAEYRAHERRLCSWHQSPCRSYRGGYLSFDEARTEASRANDMLVVGLPIMVQHPRLRAGVTVGQAQSGCERRIRPDRQPGAPLPASALFKFGRVGPMARLRTLLAAPLLEDSSKPDQVWGQLRASSLALASRVGSS